MTYLVLVLWVGAVYHYFTEAILAPSLRALLRFELFRMRDRLRSLRADGQLDLESFDDVHAFLNTAIRLVPAISVSAMAESQRAIESDPALRNRIELRLARLESLANPEARELARSACRTVYRSLLVNSAGWFVWLVPIAFVVFSFQRAYDLIKRLLTIPESDIPRIFPTSLGSLAT